MFSRGALSLTDSDSFVLLLLSKSDLDLENVITSFQCWASEEISRTDLDLEEVCMFKGGSFVNSGVS